MQVTPRMKFEYRGNIQSVGCFNNKTKKRINISYISNLVHHITDILYWWDSVEMLSANKLILWRYCFLYSGDMYIESVQIVNSSILTGVFSSCLLYHHDVVCGRAFECNSGVFLHRDAVLRPYTFGLWNPGDWQFQLGGNTFLHGECSVLQLREVKSRRLNLKERWWCCCSFWNFE